MCLNLQAIAESFCSLVSHCFELVYKDVMIDLIADTIDKAIQNQKDESTGSVSSSEYMDVSKLYLFKYSS